MDLCSDEENFYKLDNVLTRSTRFLRQIFKNKWKVETGEEWKDDQNYIQTYFVQYCKNVVSKAVPLQKQILLKSSSVEDWDISLISLVLLNLGDGKKYKLENKAVRQLKALRNELAHHKSKSLSQTEYCEKVEKFQDSFKVLKVKKSEIDKLLKESSMRLSLTDTELLNILLKTADRCMKSNDFESALKKYTEALTIPRLSLDNLRNVYEKRAACYLSINDDCVSNRSSADQAILDVDQALELHKYSWNALYLKAQWFKAKNDLIEAIRHYEMALALSPIQIQIKQELYSCRLQNSIQKGNTRLNNDELPKLLSEVLGDMKDETGRPLTLKKALEFSGCQNCPVNLGQMYYLGLEVSQDYTKAVKYFKQADKQGLTQGTFELGSCYYNGHGVPQDLIKAVEIYKRCASINAKKTRKFETVSPLGYNLGVANSECELGNCHELGTGVEKCISEAVIWYRRAMERGHGLAATNLGICYSNGEGLPKNDKMAEMCWKQGLNFGNTYAAECLLEYYRGQLEPEMTWIMLKVLEKWGTLNFLKCQMKSFVEICTHVKLTNVTLKGM